eukprot:scaffold17062_cov143-Skeletonema_menzelii.AAC.1
MADSVSFKRCHYTILLQKRKKRRERMNRREATGAAAGGFSWLGRGRRSKPAAGNLQGSLPQRQ